MSAVRYVVVWAIAPLLGVGLALAVTRVTGREPPVPAVLILIGLAIIVGLRIWR